MKLTTKKISASTRKIKSKVTREQLQDLYNFNNYYIAKSLLTKVINNDLISFKEKDVNVYYVYINYKLFERLKKLNKIVEDESTNEIIEYVEYVDKHKTNNITDIEKILVDELTQAINKEILKNIKKLK